MTNVTILCNQKRGLELVNGLLVLLACFILDGGSSNRLFLLSCRIKERRRLVVNLYHCWHDLVQKLSTCIFEVLSYSMHQSRDVKREPENR